jgi:hypothetical protein
MAVKYRETIDLLTNPGEIKSNCNSITIINEGTATAFVNGVTLITGAQYIVNGNEGEENITQYVVSFGAGTTLLRIIRKQFV